MQQRLARLALDPLADEGFSLQEEFSGSREEFGSGKPQKFKRPW